MKNNVNEMPGYIKFLRVFVFGISAFLWVLSIIWSTAGFSIDNADLAWIGVGLALSVTGAELLFNRGSTNPTIFLVGLAAYIYGFFTNFLGISQAVGVDFTQFSSNPLKILAGSLGVAALSIIVEAAPESFLLWAIYPKEKSPGDFISSLFGGMNLPKSQGKSNGSYTFPPRSEQRSNVRGVPVHQNSSPNMNNPVQNLSPTEQSVLSFVRKYKQEHNNRMPKYREIVKNTKLTSTSQVSSILERLNITS